MGTDYNTKNGMVKFFDERKGFGFIIPDEGGKDLFFHNTGVSKKSRPLTKGDKVVYCLADGKKGIQAVEIERY